MMVTCLVAILVAHFVGDYVLQTRWMGNEKFRSFRALVFHVVFYGCALVGMCLVLRVGDLTCELGYPSWGYPSWGNSYGKWIVGNMFLHGVVDFFSSRGAKYCWGRRDLGGGWEYLTFLIMGVDQLVHVLCLVLTWPGVGVL